MKLDKTSEEWQDWKWQQKNSIKDVREAGKYFPNVNSLFFENLYKKTGERFKFQITPYILSHIPLDISENDLIRNPWFVQFFPLGDIYKIGHDAYDGTDNWEFSEEFPTGNIQHKYTNRALIRFRNCLGYCNFCFEALGTLEKHPKEEKLYHAEDWNKSLEYIKNNPEIEEIVLSGGEPLLNSDSKLENILKDISEIKDEKGNPKVKFKRIHTRALTFNPFRVTDNLIQTIKNYRINEIALDVSHPSELTYDFENAVGKIKEGTGRYSPIFVLHTPLLKNINDNSDILWELFGKAYAMNIKPYYLLHAMPHTPFADKQRISVRDGVKLIKKLKRHKSNIAIPEYVIVHYEGKQTVPLEMNGTPEFQYITDKKNNPLVRFLNWKNNWVEYPDAKDTIK